MQFLSNNIPNKRTNYQSSEINFSQIGSTGIWTRDFYI